MKTAEKNATTAPSANATKSNAPKTENRPSLSSKEAKQGEPVKPATPQPGAKVEAVQTGDDATIRPAAMDNQPANFADQAGKSEVAPVGAPSTATEEKAAPTAEPAKPEIRYIMPPRNVEATLKEVESLHRKGVQRMNLITRKKQLEAFEVALTEGADELSDNPFQGCKLIIEDDKRRQFVTTTPGLIRLVAQFIYEACDKKLAEVEASIVFPNA